MLAVSSQHARITQKLTFLKLPKNRQLILLKQIEQKE
jgi:hypothetical protein